MASVQKEPGLSIKKAAKILGVNPKTVRSWVECKRLPSIEEDYILKRIYIPADAIKDARKVVCKVCGKTFTAARPKKALFCSAKHRMAFFLEKKEKEAAAKKRKSKKSAK